MSNPWFRLYHEFADDPKVQIMSEPMQRRLVMLFCERCKGETFHETERAFHWRISPQELIETKALFLEKEFIDQDWILLNWAKRQYISDSSTARVRKHRQGKKQDETLQQQNETNETPSVTGPEAEQKQIKKQKQKKSIARSVPPEELAGTLPLVDGTEYLVSKSQIWEWTQAYPGITVKTELLGFKSWLNANPTRKKTARGIERSIVHWLSGAQNKSYGKSNGSGFNGKSPDSKIDRAFNAATELINEIENHRGADGGELLPGGGAD